MAVLSSVHKSVDFVPSGAGHRKSCLATQAFPAQQLHVWKQALLLQQRPCKLFAVLLTHKRCCIEQPVKTQEMQQVAA
ncbi:hypothetical protein AZH45_00510 [Corynebacterium striatum]|nr:hypothetical protein AZH45_00510 [Corynebacterium striatum]PIS63759.1 hypothetical protein AZH47_06640 [Corynebacterium striatum]